MLDIVDPRSLTREALENEVRAFVSDAADLPVESVGVHDHIYETLGVDSLGGVAIFVDLTIRFGVPEPVQGAELADISTVHLLCDYVILMAP